MKVPVRVDFAGGWLDVPKLAIPGAFIVNCSISPLVSKEHWPYKNNSGIGGSAAWAMLNGKDGIRAELKSGVGWQDPAVISETGLCVWASGPVPVLVYKRNPSFLTGLMALLWVGGSHVTKDLVNTKRNYGMIEDASKDAFYAVKEQDVNCLQNAIYMSYEAQIEEGMKPLPLASGCTRKYCGSGWGGYALYLFEHKEPRDEFVRDTPDAMAIEPFMDYRWS